jgi:hypothetical protein
MPNYAELRTACDAMRSAPDRYRPAVFWEEATSKIVSEIETHGVDSFRSLATPMSYFVPTWGRRTVDGFHSEVMVLRRRG